MIHSFIVTFGAKYLTGMVTSVPPSKTFSFIKNNILQKSLQISEVCDLGHVGHVTYNFINLLFISTGIFADKLRPQILAVGTTANSPLRTKLYNKGDDFNFPIVNFQFICSNILAASTYGVYISHLIRYSRACGFYHDFLDRGLLLTRKQRNQGFLVVKLKFT